MDCKQVCFNDLSLTPLCTDKQEAEVRIRQYVEVLNTMGMSIPNRTCNRSGIPGLVCGNIAIDKPGETEYQEKLRSIHLRDDHGKDVLEEHAKKLLHSPYVKSIINSLPFNSNATRYIWQIKENGIINIVLHWTDNGYGMAIQTTGRNIRETLAIGKIIEEKYGRK